MKDQLLRQAIAQRLVAYLNNNNLTQKKLAKLISIHLGRQLKRCTLASYIERRATPPLDISSAIAKAISVSIDELIKVG